MFNKRFHYEKWDIKEIFTASISVKLFLYEIMKKNLIVE